MGVVSLKLILLLPLVANRLETDLYTKLVLLNVVTRRDAPKAISLWEIKMNLGLYKWDWEIPTSMRFPAYYHERFKRGTHRLDFKTFFLILASFYEYSERFVPFHLPNTLAMSLNGALFLTAALLGTAGHCWAICWVGYTLQSLQTAERLSVRAS